MDKETQQLIKDRYNALPLSLQQAIDSADAGKKITEIGKKYSLLIDQENSLYLEIFFAMLGLEPLTDITENIAKNVGVSSTTAVSISRDVNEKIFLPIRESLQQIQLPTKDETLEETPNPERDQIMHDIENPVPTPEREIAVKSATDDFISNKLSAPSISSNEITTIKVPANPEAPSSQKKYSTDPYREPIN